MHPPTPSKLEVGRRFVRIRNLRARYDDVTDITIDRWIKNNGFPRPFIFSRVRFWDLDEVEAYERKRRK